MFNPHFLLSIMALGWAGNAIAGKYAIGHISPMLLTFCRWSLALVVLLLFTHRVFLKDWHIVRRYFGYFLFMGAIGYSFFNYMLYSALYYTSSINVAIEQTAMPLFIFILNFLLYKVATTKWQFIGYFFTLFGVVLVVSHGEPLSLFASGINRGDFIMIIAALFYAAYSVGLRHQPKIEFTSFLAAMICGAVIVSLFGLLYEFARGQIIVPHSWQAVAVVVYTGLVPSLMSQGFFIFGVATLGANKAGLYINLVPIFTSILAVLLLQDELHLYHCLAFVLTVGGIIIATHKNL